VTTDIKMHCLCGFSLSGGVAAQLGVKF